MPVTLQPFDLQIITVPLWKDLAPFINIFYAQETCSISKIAFALSKSPHLQRARFLVTVRKYLHATVLCVTVANLHYEWIMQIIVHCMIP